MKLIAQNTTGNVATLRILDDVGAPKTGVVYNAAGLAVWYIPEGGTPVQITLTSGNWTETKFGEYEVDVPDAAYQTVQTVRIVGSLTDFVVIPDRHQVFASLWTSLPSAGTIATAVVERAVSDSQPVGSVGYILHALSTMVEFLGGLWRYKAASLSQSPTESGIGQYQITLVADSTGGQVPGVVFRIVDTVLNVTTGSDGEAIINLDAGTYTLRTVVPPGYDVVADQAMVVSGDATVTVTLTSTAVTPANPPLCAVVLPVVDQYGAAIAGVSVMIEFVSFANTADPDAVVMSPPPVLTSDENGQVTVDLLRLANYKATYAISGSVKRVDFEVPDAGSYVVVEPN